MSCDHIDSRDVRVLFTYRKALRPAVRVAFHVASIDTSIDASLNASLNASLDALLSASGFCPTASSSPRLVLNYSTT